MITHTTHAYTHARALRHTHTKKEIETEREKKERPIKDVQTHFQKFVQNFFRDLINISRVKSIKWSGCFIIVSLQYSLTNKNEGIQTNKFKLNKYKNA